MTTAGDNFIYESTEEDAPALLDAIPLQVHRKTDYPAMKEQLVGLFAEVVTLRASRGQQLRKSGRVKKHLDALILDLWVAANYTPSPWRIISRNRNDYTKESRYRKIYLKFNLLLGVLDDLIDLGYVEQKIGFYDKEKGRGFQTRIKASASLLSILNFDISQIVRDPEAPEEELIILRDEEGKLSDYEDDQFTNAMREFLSSYNETLRNASINTDAIDLLYKYDPTSITLKQIFKGKTINEAGGGRFYGGFWENMPKLDRLKILLEGGPVVELDYAALHPSITYALKGLPLPDEPYSIEGCERSEVKKAFLVLFNCSSREHAVNTIKSFGIKNVEQLVTAIESKHAAIKGSFFNPGFGMTLQNTDAWIAETVLKQMTEIGILALSVHDSFIVQKCYEKELFETMERVFEERFFQKPIIK